MGIKEQGAERSSSSDRRRAGAGGRWAELDEAVAGRPVCTTLAALAGHPLVLAEVGKAVEDANARLARVQQVKRWRLLPAGWTAESEELTPTLKLRRRVVHTKYAAALDGLYGG